MASHFISFSHPSSDNDEQFEVGPGLRGADRGYESVGCARAQEISAAAEESAAESCVYGAAVDAWLSACQVAKAVAAQAPRGSAGRGVAAALRESERIACAVNCRDLHTSVSGREDSNRNARSARRKETQRQHRGAKGVLAAAELLAAALRMQGAEDYLPDEATPEEEDTAMEAADAAAQIVVAARIVAEGAVVPAAVALAVPSVSSAVPSVSLAEPAVVPAAVTLTVPSLTSAKNAPVQDTTNAVIQEEARKQLLRGRIWLRSGRRAVAVGAARLAQEPKQAAAVYVAWLVWDAARDAVYAMSEAVEEGREDATMDAEGTAERAYRRA